MWVVGFGWVHAYFGGKESRSIDCGGGVGWGDLMEKTSRAWLFKSLLMLIPG